MARPKMPPIETLTAKEIRTLRQRYDLTQHEFGTLLGTDAKTVSRWETGTPIRSRAYKTLILQFRDHDVKQPDFEDRVRAIRYASTD
jgi:DNA-binding transcriptional regulator YiaG